MATTTVVVYRDATKKEALILDPSWELKDFLTEAEKKLGMPSKSASKVFWGCNGGKVDDIAQLFHGDSYYISQGEAFPEARSRSRPTSTSPGLDAGLDAVFKKMEVVIEKFLESSRQKKQALQDMFPPGRFIVLDCLAKTSSQVYKVQDTVSNSYAVLKAATQIERQLPQEYEMLTQHLLGCSGIPTVLASASSDKYFAVLEQPLGETLTDFLSRKSLQDRTSLLKGWIPSLVKILGGIHQRGVIHCDVKPNNIIIASNQLFVIDFGLASFGYDSYGFEGTRAFASVSSLAGCCATPSDDFESLSYTVYALKIGVDKWYELVKRSERPSLDCLVNECELVKLVHTLSLKSTSRKKPRKCK